MRTTLRILGAIAWTIAATLQTCRVAPAHGETMPGKINIYNLGEMGVNLVKSPLHQSDGELIAAQNCCFDKNQDAGGLAKRPGMARLNSVPLGGPVRGALSVAFDVPGQYTAPFGFYLPWDDGTASPITWLRSSDGITWSQTVTSPAPSSWPEVPSNLPDGYVDNVQLAEVPGGFYYASHNSTAGQLRFFDGTVDRLVAELNFTNPRGGSQTFLAGIFPRDDKLYLVLHDAGPSGNPSDVGNRVVVMNPRTGAMQQVGNSFGAQTGEVGDYYPTCLGIGFGRLWALGKPRTGGGPGKLFSIFSDTETEWTTEHTFTDNLVPSSIAEFQGSVYVGTHSNDLADAAIVLEIAPDGTKTTSDTGSTPGTSFGSYSRLQVSGDALFAIDYTDAGTPVLKVRTFDGSSWSTDRDIIASDFGGTLPFGAKLQGVRDVEGALFLAITAATAPTMGDPLLIRRSSAGVYTTPITYAGAGATPPSGDGTAWVIALRD